MSESKDIEGFELAEDASEFEDHVKIVLPPKPAAKIPHGIVISGEASESDEEIDTQQHTLPQSESNFSISDTWRKSPLDPDKEFTKGIQHNSLLHKKLREKNAMFRKDVVEMVTQPYESATKEIHTISQQLIKSQLLVQDLRNTIRRLTNDLFEMEDKMEALKTGSFLPNVGDIPTPESFENIS